MARTTIKTTRFVTLATYAANRPVEGAVVTVLDSTHEARGLKLISTYSRALRKNSIHELIATDETGKKPGRTSAHTETLPAPHREEKETPGAIRCPGAETPV